jgi:RNA polymerase sigma-70 factor (ECF subfamily)
VETRGVDAGRALPAALHGGAAPVPVDVKLDVRRRLEALPDRLREVLVLRYFEGLSEPEIASVAGIPGGTVKSRLHAAVKALRGQEATLDVD